VTSSSVQAAATSASVSRRVASTPRPRGRFRGRCNPLGAHQNHIDVIRTDPSSLPDWLDSFCWRCGSQAVDPVADGRVLCGACRNDLDSESPTDPIGLARHAYWEAHALRCCWRCMVRAVDPEDELGICRACREQIVGEGAA